MSTSSTQGTLGIIIPYFTVMIHCRLVEDMVIMIPRLSISMKKENTFKGTWILGIDGDVE